MSHNPNSPQNLAGDAIAFGIIPLAWYDVLPKIAAGLSIVWLCLQFYSWIINKGWKRNNNG